MFKTASFENEIANEMATNLTKKSNINNELNKSIDNINKVSELLDNLGLKIAADKLTEIIESIK